VNSLVDVRTPKGFPVLGPGRTLWDCVTEEAEIARSAVSDRSSPAVLRADQHAVKSREALVHELRMARTKARR
jgi:hypothetical protein